MISPLISLLEICESYEEATMAAESNLRKQEYLKHGCNAFDTKRPSSTPMGFWTEQDVLQ